MLVGAVVHSIIISEVIGIVTSTDEVQRVIDKQLALIDAYTAHAHMDADTAKEIKSVITWRAKNWATSYGFDKTEMKDLLTGKYMPRWLLSKMPKSIFNGALLRNNFLRCVTDVPARLPCLLAVHLITCDFQAGEVVYQMGDYPFNIFLVLSGTFAFVGRPSPAGGQDAMEVDEIKLHVAHTNSLGEAAAAVSSMLITETNNNKSDRLYPYRLFSCQSYFGETEMLMGKPRLSTARCERKGVGLTLHKSDFLDIKEMFPQFGSLWASAMRRRERFRKLARACLTKPTTCKVLSVTRIQEFWRYRGQKLPSEQRRASSRFTEVAVANHQRLRRSSIEAPSATRGDADSISSLRGEIESLRMEIRQLVKEQRKFHGVPDQGGTASATLVVRPGEHEI
uniref:Cyclic nucleotide-binding domain-containing protein n=1 Tax=Alexandrium catenella TaxID=2925 RepID=A0A7S1M9Y0_ALECA